MENVKDDEDEAQRCWGARRRLYSNSGTGKIQVGSYTMRTGVQEQTLKQVHIKFQGVSPHVPVQFSWDKEAITKRALWVMGTLPMANRTKGQRGEMSEQKSRGSEGQWDGVREGCGADYAGLCQSRSELAGTDMGFGVRSGGHADVIG